MNRIIITAMAIALLTSCGKKNKKQYSYWKVNGVEYSSNNVIKSESTRSPISSIFSRDNIRFDITFYLWVLPRSGEFTINYTIQTPAFVSCGFYFDTIPYGVKEGNIVKLYASEQNGKAQYSLEPTWFFNYNNSNDSILIEGIFNEP